MEFIIGFILGSFLNHIFCKYMGYSVHNKIKKLINESTKNKVKTKSFQERLDEKGKWINKYFCKYCEHILSFEEKMDSHGRCPYCGKKGPNACTIIDTIEKAVKT